MDDFDDFFEKEFKSQNKDESVRDNPSDYLTEYMDGVTDKKAVYVFNLPTGSGKTHNIFQFIGKKGRGHYNYCIYVVPQRKQRSNAYEEYKSCLGKYGVDGSECIELYGHAEQAFISFNHKIHERLREQLEELAHPNNSAEVDNALVECQKALDELVNTLQFRIDNPAIREITEGKFSDEAVSELDANLRYELKKLLLLKMGVERIPSPDSLEELCKNMDLCFNIIPCLRELYPWLRIYRCKTVLCTAAKFLLSLPMLVNPDVVLYRSSFMKGALVVLDESDGIYQEWLNHLLKNPSSRTVYSLYDTFCIVCDCLESALGKIPHKYACRKEIEQLITETLRRKEKLYETAGMKENLPIYTRVQEEKLRYCIFHTDETRHLLSAKGKDMDIYIDKEENMHILSPDEYKPADSENSGPEHQSIYSVARNMVSILKYVAVTLSEIVNRKMELDIQLQQDIRDGRSSGGRWTVTRDKIIRQVYTMVNLNRAKKETVELIKRMGNIYSDVSNIPVFDNDYSHFNRGWLLMHLDFDDADNVGKYNRTNIHYLTQNTTPEKILRQMFQNQNMTVILMSATAASRSLSTNFNLDYLGCVLGDNMVYIPEDVLYKFEKAMERYLPSLDERPVVCSVLPEGTFENGGYGKMQLIPVKAVELFPENVRPVAHKFLRRLRNMLLEYFNSTGTEGMEKSVKHYMTQYYKFFAAYKAFNDNPRLYSALCFTERLPKNTWADGGILWSREILSQGAALIDGRIKTMEECEFFKYNPDLDERIAFVDSTDYEIKSKQVVQAWSRGEKRMMISSYKTVGAGMNLAYAIPDRIRWTGNPLPYMQQISQMEWKKDIDCIVLMEITGHRHFSRFGSRSSGNGQIELYLYINHLLSLQYSGQIPFNKVRKEIANVIAYDFSVLNQRNISLVEDLAEYQMYKVIQSMGRISRSTIKGEETLILYEDGLTQSIALALDKMPYSFELRRLREHIKQSSSNEDALKFDKKKEDISVNTAINLCNNARNRMESLIAGALANYHTLDSEVTENTRHLQEYVDKIKRHMAMYPTIDNSMMNDEIRRNLWLYHHLSGRGAAYSVKFKKGSDMFIEGINSLSVHKQHWLDVNEQETYLPLLMQNEYVYNWFESQSFARKWIPGDYVLSPYIALSTYKGFIGEQAFEGIMRGGLSKELERLTGNMYEVTDFQLKDSRVMFDVKNYNPLNPFHPTEKDMSVNLLHKVKKSNSMLVVVNMLYKDDDPPVELWNDIVFINGLINMKTGKLISKTVDKLFEILDNNK